MKQSRGRRAIERRTRRGQRSEGIEGEMQRRDVGEASMLNAQDGPVWYAPRRHDAWDDERATRWDVIGTDQRRRGACPRHQKSETLQDDNAPRVGRLCWTCERQEGGVDPRRRGGAGGGGSGSLVLLLPTVALTVAGVVALPFATHPIAPAPLPLVPLAGVIPIARSRATEVQLLALRLVPRQRREERRVRRQPVRT